MKLKWIIFFAFVVIADAIPLTMVIINGGFDSIDWAGVIIIQAFFIAVGLAMLATEKSRKTENDNHSFNVAIEVQKIIVEFLRIQITQNDLVGIDGFLWTDAPKFGEKVTITTKQDDSITGYYLSLKENSINVYCGGFQSIPFANHVDIVIEKTTTIFGAPATLPKAFFVVEPINFEHGKTYKWNSTELFLMFDCLTELQKVMIGYVDKELITELESIANGFHSNTKTISGRSVSKTTCAMVEQQKLLNAMNVFLEPQAQYKRGVNLADIDNIISKKEQ